MALKSNPNGKCQVCAHPERVRIELLVAGGASQSAVARKFNLSNDVVHRHWHGHISEERRATLLIGPVEREALAAQLSEESESVIDHLKAIRAGLYRFFMAALDAGDRMTGTQVAAQLRATCDSIGKITGELSNSPLVQHNTQINFNMTPEFGAFQADLIRALTPYPDACRAVVAEFQRLEATQQPAQLPALEQRREPANPA